MTSRMSVTVTIPASFPPSETNAIVTPAFCILSMTEAAVSSTSTFAGWTM